MKEQILKMLRANQNEYLSGEELCRRFNVSRTAIWKHIKDLQEEGYEIDAVRNKGYRLVSAPDIVTAAEIREGLSTRRLGQHIVAVKELDSTNVLAAKLAETGEPDGTLVIADCQTGGKGRRGKAWFSPPGTGIWMSLILRPHLPLAQAPQLTLVAAVAVGQVLSDLAGHRAGIKWPNDILFEDRKCCGILTEMNMESEEITRVIVGIGINVNQTEIEFPDELRDIATSLRIVAGRPFHRAKVVQRILERFELLYDQYAEYGSFAPIREQWKQQSITLGRYVSAHTPRGLLTGLAVDIDEMGALVLETDSGRQKVYSADIQVS
ncbi:biotin--[acetyl-CoA-carboxylase] ligase [Effusibacillus lacus]|uniref:Bifunctional ligase/repressor BirA n=1 Tax=Effusibacillus lacus TaxID=1348429 RepID=A0A292YLW5_9BACL|nr:biotin--[acetyl-CoA-carboxylase] ligase [Effusibacillus lacus]TCS75329.1 BirA family biotin operon repressor/biotin-[acetyl-CoA-carboxylase] ligase [Effusibacillus lacus]GAX89763.1 bifunctional biotin--[acetyl-CoA-carboxylase] synthetase/biotin operon repressor [Effusibacillus lacus]